MVIKLPLFLARLRQLAPLILVFVSAVVAVIAYLQALHYPFIADDIGYTAENYKLASLHFTELWRLLVEPYNCCFEFLPLRDLSYWSDITLFGLNPSSFRIHNIFLYLFCLPLVYATTLGIWRYFRAEDVTGAPWAAAAVTALFALHPALVESVVWISGRKYILPNLFAMLALWLAVSAKRKQGLSVPYATATLFAFVAMMLSKTSYVGVAPIIAMLWGLFWLDMPAVYRRYSLLLWPFIVLLLAGLLMGNFIAINNGYDRIPFYFGVEAFTRTFAVLGWLARLAVSPENRHYFYPVFEDSYLPIMVVLGVAVLLAAVAGGIMILRRRSLEGFALFSFLLLCVPYMQLIPNGPPSLVSDRYLALAVWPAVLFIVALVWRFKPGPRRALLLVIAFLWGLQTLQRPRDWHSYEALVDSDFRAFSGFSMPAMYKSDFQLSQGLIREAGETASGITIPEVRSTMLKLVKAHQSVNDSALNGDPHDAMIALLDYGFDLKQFPDYAQWNTPIRGIWIVNRRYLGFEWKRLVRYFPNDAFLLYNAGTSLLSLREYEDAILHFRSAIETQRLSESLRGMVFRNLGIALINSGHDVEGENSLRAALQQSQPDFRAHCSLAELYQQKGRLEEFALAKIECRKLVPSGADDIMKIQLPDLSKPINRLGQ